MHQLLPKRRLWFHLKRKGSNSFTESQARSRIEGAGFGKVTGLAKDQQGIWRGKAQKDGRMVSVGLDFKGNVASQ